MWFIYIYLYIGQPCFNADQLVCLKCDGGGLVPPCGIWSRYMVVRQRILSVCIRMCACMTMGLNPSVSTHTDTDTHKLSLSQAVSQIKTLQLACRALTSTWTILSLPKNVVRGFNDSLKRRFSQRIRLKKVEKKKKDGWWCKITHINFRPRVLFYCFCKCMFVDPAAVCHACNHIMFTAWILFFNLPYLRTFLVVTSF